MTTRIINGLLFFTFIIGAVLAFRADVERRKLQAEFDRLVTEYGHLPIEDKDKVHMVAIKMEDPMHFRWRMYLPPNHRYRWRHRNGSSYGSASKDPKNFISQVRLRNEEDNGLMVFYSHDSGSGTGSTYRGEAGKFLFDHWDEMEISVAAQDGVTAYPLDQVIDAVRIEMSEKLFAKFSEKFPRDAKWRGPTVYHRTIGTQEAYDKADKVRDGRATP